MTINRNNFSWHRSPSSPQPQHRNVTPEEVHLSPSCVRVRSSSISNSVLGTVVYLSTLNPLCMYYYHVQRQENRNSRDSGCEQLSFDINARSQRILTFSKESFQSFAMLRCVLINRTVHIPPVAEQLQRTLS